TPTSHMRAVQTFSRPAPLATEEGISALCRLLLLADLADDVEVADTAGLNTCCRIDDRVDHRGLAGLDPFFQRFSQFFRGFYTNAFTAQRFAEPVVAGVRMELHGRELVCRICFVAAIDTAVVHDDHGNGQVVTG